MVNAVDTARARSNHKMLLSSMQTQELYKVFLRLQQALHSFTSSEYLYPPTGIDTFKTGQRRQPNKLLFGLRHLGILFTIFDCEIIIGIFESRDLCRRDSFNTTKLYFSNKKRYIRLVLQVRISNKSGCF